MQEGSDNNSVKIAIVGMTGSGKTVLITMLAIKMSQMVSQDIYLLPSGPNRRQTLKYTQNNWQILNNGQWPPSTPAGELVELQWELATKEDNQATIQFLDCAGQDICSLFRADKFNSSSLRGDLKRVYESVVSANILIILVNMEDFLSTTNNSDEVGNLDQMIVALRNSNDIPRKVAVVFSQFDKYIHEVNSEFNGNFEKYVQHYLLTLYVEYKRHHNFDIIPVAAVSETRSVLENGNLKQYPAPDFQSYNLDTLIKWIARGVDELAPKIAKANKNAAKKEEERKPEEVKKESVQQNDLYKRFTDYIKKQNQYGQSEAERSKQRRIASWAIFGGVFLTGLLLIPLVFSLVFGIFNFLFTKCSPDNFRKAGERQTVMVNGVEFAFRWCPEGKFTMGAPESEDGRGNAEIQHQVTLTKGFWMLETEVTQKQWKAVMGNNPSYFEGDNLPVEEVSWNDCQEFCQKCSDLGLSVQLPTEAQWEYACRAGSTTAYFWGNALNGDKANCNGNSPCGTTTKGKVLNQTAPVGSYAPNPWGLYDMHGNVWEWCQDWYKDYSEDKVKDPTGPLTGSFRVNRGGAWNDYARVCRSAYRSYNEPDRKNYYRGFRVVKGQ